MKKSNQSDRSWPNRVIFMAKQTNFQRPTDTQVKGTSYYVLRYILIQSTTASDFGYCDNIFTYTVEKICLTSVTRANRRRKKKSTAQFRHVP